MWLNRTEISLLFERDIKTISKHINKALQEECRNSTVAKFAIVHLEANRYVEREISYYNLVVQDIQYQNTLIIFLRKRTKRKLVCRKIRQTALDGKQYNIDYYNLVILIV